MGREIRLEERQIKILLNLIPSGSVPEGLDPTFYHTLTYDGDAKLQKDFDAIRELLEDS